ncbi:uncharacterized protein LOC105695416 [Orussus abietinus]|uniref:uncharacterized protein LOC105695416 n=1 Tax=Orussus abietinus TaxID=222816 RepID=UPI000C7161A1|nr:uncharacterized protein LOC105695416 [Orussus abietinus]
MSCLSALHSQVVTFLSVPHQVLFLQHRVFKEYAKIAVGPDFVHTLPSFIILTAIAMVLWRNPPSFAWSPIPITKVSLYRALQVSGSWVAMNAVFWLWLIFQRVLYCSVWSYWSYDTEYRDVPHSWWQKVWSSYYPPPLQPPVLSASFISWIISMIVAVTSLGFALSPSRAQAFILDSLVALQDLLLVGKSYVDWTPVRCVYRVFLRTLEGGNILDVISCARGVPMDESNASSVCDECRSEMSTDVVNATTRRDVHPISYGTNWTPRPNFSGFQETQRKASTKSMRASVTVTGVTDRPDDFSPRQLRHRRGCHTVIPSNSSDKSSGC